MLFNPCAIFESGAAVTADWPPWMNWVTRGSIGNVASKGTSVRFDNASPPPDEKISVHSVHVGQTNPLIFSTMPRTVRSVFRQNVISLRVSSSDTSCGVVTITTPAQLMFSCGSFMHSATVMCSSDVPGGVSTIKKSNSPHSMSFMNWRIIDVFFGPRQMTGSLREPNKNAIDITASRFSASL